MMGLKETIDQLSMANSFCWYGYVLRREDDNVMRKALDFEVEGQKKKVWLMRAWREQVEEGSVKVDLRRVDTLC